MNPKVFSVGELAGIIAEVLQGSLFQNIYLRGEVQSKSSKGNYTYVTLIDTEAGGNLQATITVVVGSYCKIDQADYKIGDTLILKGSLSYYKPRGTVSFWPRNLAIDGQGQELIRLRRLKEKLQAEGLFAPEHKRPLPLYPRRIAVVTSASGAAINDIKSTLKKRFPVHLQVFSALVQGTKAADSIAIELQKAFADPDFDLLILARGGGSKADLSPFNDETVARLVFSAPFPVIAAVGHQIDTSLVDLVADRTAITPTDAANLVGLSLVELADDRRQIRKELAESFSLKLNNIRRLLESSVLLLEANSPASRLKLYRSTIIKSKDSLELSLWRRQREERKSLTSSRLQLASLNPVKSLVAARKTLARQGEELREQLTRRLALLTTGLKRRKELLQAIAPIKILERGYSLVRKDGKILTDASAVKTGDRLEVQLRDGKLPVIAE